jgi:ParB-like chromosome segregation protein Spo0J
VTLSSYYLADGFHRVAAAKSVNLEELPAEIRVGTKREAMLYACGAN